MEKLMLVISSKTAQIESWCALLTTAIAAALSAAVSAQAAPVTVETKTNAVVVDNINIVGTRRATASATDTPVPVDSIPLSKSAEQGG